MRPTLSAARDVSRVCTRCRLQALRASPLAGANYARPALYNRNTTTILSSYANIQKQHFSQTKPQSTAANDAAAPSPASASIPRTHYDLFPSTLPSGPPPSSPFPINTRLLRREFLQLQARAHPDMHPPAAKPRAEATSALINEAYKTLSNPLLRAQYLLSLRGVDVANDETLKIEEPDLLMLVLEAREEIEDAQSEEDLQAPRYLNDERVAESEHILENAFREDDIEAAKREAVRLRYWINIRDSLDAWEQGKPVVLQH